MDEFKGWPQALIEKWRDIRLDHWRRIIELPNVDTDMEYEEMMGRVGDPPITMDDVLDIHLALRQEGVPWENLRGQGPDGGACDALAVGGPGS